MEMVRTFINWATEKVACSGFDYVLDSSIGSVMTKGKDLMTDVKSN